MSSLLEHIERLDRHRALMGQPATGHVLVGFTQDRERSVEYWTDDALAATMTTEHEAALDADHRAFHARLNAQQRIRQGKSRIAFEGAQAAFDGVMEAFRAVGELFTPPPPTQSAYAVALGPRPVHQYHARGNVLEDITIDGAGPVTAERHGARRRYLA